MRGRMITAAVLAVVGLAWIGQGLGLLQGSSFMVGDPIWAAIGAALVVAAIAVAVTAWRRRAT
jgi:predicted Co/Zn/Cd cation transporter (cation efflux family)